MKLSILLKILFPILLVFLASGALIAGCDDGMLGDSPTGGGSSGSKPQGASTDTSICGDPETIIDWPKSGYYLEMKFAHEVFRVLVDSDPASEGTGAQQVKNWLAADPDSSEALGVPTGPIEMEEGYNPGYSYRFIPEEVAFTKAPADDCDASACYVEAARLAWIKNDPPTWCPWYAVVLAAWNCAGGDGSSCGDPVFTSPTVN